MKAIWVSGLVGNPREMLEGEISQPFNSPKVGRSTCNSVCLPQLSSLLYYCWIKMKWAFRTAHMTLHNDGFSNKMRFWTQCTLFKHEVVVCTGARLRRAMKKDIFRLLKKQSTKYKIYLQTAETFIKHSLIKLIR